MRRLFVSLLAVMASAVAVFGYDAAIRDISVNVTVRQDGSISVVERWDVTAASGTEWYLVRNNLGDIQIDNFSVSENGIPYTFEGAWDVDRGIAAKAFKCGIVSTSRGAELCWGIGNLGDHVFDVSYDMTNAVKSLRDYDMIHMQFVSPGLTSTPEHVRVTLEIPGVQIDTANARIWGFGYEGYAFFEEGKAVFESSERFRENSSVISLIRFEKGLTEPASIQDRPFQEALDTALSGSDYKDSDEDEDDPLSALLGLLTFGFFIWLFSWPFRTNKVSKRTKVSILGSDPDKVNWSREVPFGGDIRKAEYTLKKLGQSEGFGNYTSALILRLVQQGYIVPQQTESNMDLLLTDKDPASMDDADLMFFVFLKSAAGSNGILEKKEFTKWAGRNASRLRSWASKLTSEARSAMVDAGELNGSHKYTEAGQAQARNTLGFKKFLKDFTLVSERGTPEVALWQDYLAFAALYGIADVVAKQLRQINPDVFQEAVSATAAYDMASLIRLSDAYGRTVKSSITPPSSSYSGGGSFRSSGGGGRSSFGGGGGFSGGGRGGGSR